MNLFLNKYLLKEFLELKSKKKNLQFKKTMGAAIIINSGHGRCCQKCPPQAVNIFWILRKLVKNL